MGTLCNSAKRQSMEQKMNGKLKKAGILALMGALVLAAVGGIASKTAKSTDANRVSSKT